MITTGIQILPLPSSLSTARHPLTRLSQALLTFDFSVYTLHMNSHMRQHRIHGLKITVARPIVTSPIAPTRTTTTRLYRSIPNSNSTNHLTAGVAIHQALGRQSSAFEGHAPDHKQHARMVNFSIRIHGGEVHEDSRPHKTSQGPSLATIAVKGADALRAVA